MWKLKKSNSSTISNEFYISNAKYEEKLAPVKVSEKRHKCKGSKLNRYCSEDNNNKSNREVFTWPDKEIDSEPSPFESRLKCRNIELLRVSQKS
jgi:hypothetical protein